MAAYLVSSFLKKIMVIGEVLCFFFYREQKPFFVDQECYQSDYRIAFPIGVIV